MTIGQPERATQNRVIALFRDELGYQYLGDWRDRDGNSNLEESHLSAYLTKNDYSPVQINKTIYKLRAEVSNPNRTFYDNNKRVYSLLRYGVPVVVAAGENTETIKVINWTQPHKNDFAIAEEVTVFGN